MTKDMGRRFTVRLNPLDEQHAKILDYIAKLKKDKSVKSVNSFFVEAILQKIAEEEEPEPVNPNKRVYYRDLMRLKVQLELMIKDEIIKAFSNGYEELKYIAVGLYYEKCEWDCAIWLDSEWHTGPVYINND